jgi:hypothetical protein
MRWRPVSVRAGLPMVLLLAVAVLTLTAYQCSEQLESSEQTQGREVGRPGEAARLAR